jgi:cysteine desulfurase / selenocysteine lyase
MDRPSMDGNGRQPGSPDGVPSGPDLMRLAAAMFGTPAANAGGSSMPGAGALPSDALAAGGAVPAQGASHMGFAAGEAPRMAVPQTAALSLDESSAGALPAAPAEIPLADGSPSSILDLAAMGLIPTPSTVGDPRGGDLYVLAAPPTSQTATTPSAVQAPVMGPDARDPAVMTSQVAPGLAAQEPAHRRAPVDAGSAVTTSATTGWPDRTDPSPPGLPVLAPGDPDPSIMSIASRDGSGFSPPAADPAPQQPWEVASVRAEFPVLQQRVHGHRLVWLDNAATTQKPQVVIDAVRDFYDHYNSNIHRSAHTLAGRASAAYEEARERIARFIGAESPSEIVFTRGTTESVNLLANTFGRAFVGRGDEILVSQLEHHSNIVPWQFLAQQTGAVLRVIPVDDRGDVDLAAYASMLGPRTKLVAISQVSNAIGTVVPVVPMTQLAHNYGARVLVDGAQSVAHLPVCVGPAGIDFFAFSGHKVFAPTGIGVLYGRAELLEAMPPWQGGGSMIDTVTFERTTFAPPPAKFEAGTPHISGAIGLGVALEWLDQRGRTAVAAYEHELMQYATEVLREIPGLHLIGDPTMRAGALPFVMDGYRPEEVARHVDQYGIALRAGHHCAQPILRRFGHAAVVRPSLALYNIPADIDALAGALRQLPRRAS